MFGNDRTAIRQQFINAWQKYRLPGTTLSPLESMIAEIISRHPEYHAFFNQEDGAVTGMEFGQGDTPNPFFHLGLHISLQEQLQTDRPAGIRELFQQLTNKTSDPHQAEHLMMECLEKSLWEAQSQGVMPDEKLYLDCLKRKI